MAYPTDPWYDPCRPSWLPYFIDDITESENKANYAIWTATPVPIGGMPTMVTSCTSSNPNPYPNPPVIAGASSGDVNSDGTITFPPNVNSGSSANFFSSVTGDTSTATNTVGSFLNTLDPTLPSSNQANWIWVIIGGVAIFWVFKELGKL